MVDIFFSPNNTKRQQKNGCTNHMLYVNKENVIEKIKIKIKIGIFNYEIFNENRLYLHLKKEMNCYDS